MRRIELLKNSGDLWHEMAWGQYREGYPLAHVAGFETPEAAFKALMAKMEGMKNVDV